jgi:hypothetical protein
MPMPNNSPTPATSQKQAQNTLNGIRNFGS